MTHAGVRYFAWASIALLPAVTIAAAQQTPVFRASVELVPVDVSIVDNEGRPVEGLTADDFTLKVDGRPRNIGAVEFVDQRGLTLERAAPTDAHYSSNDMASVGRLIMLAIDESSFPLGQARSVLATASKFIDQLSPADQMALAVFPGTGPNIDFTTNHQVVRRALTRITGKADHIMLDKNIGIREAYDIGRGDTFTLREVITRECPAGNSDLLCPEVVEQEARSIGQQLQVQSRISLGSLRGILSALKQVEGTKTLVLVSSGLIADPSQAEVTDLGELARSAQVNIYVLHVDLPRFDASASRPSPTASEDEQLRTTGLETLAGTGRGAIFKVTGSGEYAFKRIGSELSGYYLLTFEPEENDRNGKRHAIQISVKRRGVTLRARREFTVEPPSAARTEQEQLIGLLRAPLMATKLPLRLTTYLFQDSRSSKVRTLVSVQSDGTASDAAPTAVGFIIQNEKGNIVASSFDKVTTANWATQAVLDSGSYRLKLAAIDGEGRRGSVEHRFTASVASAGPVKVGDLMLAEMPERPGGPVRPTVDVPMSDRMLAYTEVYTDQRQVLIGASAVFEIAESADGDTLLSTPSEPTAPSGRQRALQGALPVRLLPPGDYVVRAKLMQGTQVLTTLSRPFRILRPLIRAASSETDGEGLPASTDAARLRPSMPPLDRNAALAPDVMGYFLERLPEFQSGGESPGIDEAIRLARNAQFDAAARAAAGSTSSDRLVSAFMRGLALYVKGDYQGSQREMKVASGLSTEFYPALVYIGASFAASGRLGDAVAAYQTSLSIDNEVRPTFFLLSDVLFRLNDGEQAASILEEAREIWPDDRELAGRLATAYAMIGRQRDSFSLLEEYLQAGTDDPEALFLAMRLLYEAHLSDQPYRGGGDDVALLKQYAERYAAAGGPLRPIVERWVRYLEQGEQSKF